MGRSFSVDFEESEYYMCKNCRTHIALPVTPDSTPQPGRRWGIFITVINVEVDRQTRQLYRNEVTHTVSDVYCVKCGDNLGFKYILTDSDERGDRSNDLLQLKIDKLLWRKGDSVRDAETLIVVE